ncbi:putative mediator of RNA polymerase II transcription subunit 26 [Malaya genurostris]|uniref:putative mediator of RNA polymerase II transcription subunit 26 n=1 Tax=Malaya genurostris TaxID=325434 RepID=UPI0026F3C4FB|nr:putative mediator of RNA polymerase II transcription subunit 26 [Malaya genurostris]
MHFRFRLSLISDPLITTNANKTVAKIQHSLEKLEDFFMNCVQVNSREDEKVPDPEEELPGDIETQKRLRMSQLQLSLKETSNQQQLLEQELQRQLHQVKGQIAPDVQYQQSYQEQIQRQQQQLQQQQEMIRQYQQHHQQKQQLRLQQQQQGQQLQQQLEQQLLREQAQRQQLEAQLHEFRNRNATSPENQVNNSIPRNWDPYLQNQSGIPQHQQTLDYVPPYLRQDFIRFLRSQSTPRDHQQSTQSRFSQPVHKWPFEYTGQPNIIQLGEFLNQVNTYADTEGIDEKDLLRSVKHLLKGRALQWYTRLYSHLTSWEIFKSEIKQEFLPPNFSEIIKQDLYLRFQGQNESFTSFYRYLIAAFEIVEPSMSESEKLFIVKSHLNPDYTPIAAASRATTVKELVAVCKDFEVS